MHRTKRMIRLVAQFGADQSGATAIEYALIGSMISIMIVSAVVVINQNMDDMYDYIGDHITAALTGDNQ